MKHEPCERWVELADREAEGDTLAASERAFLTAHVLDCEACAKEARFYELLAEGQGQERGREHVVDAVLRRAADGNVVPIGAARRTLPSGSVVVEPLRPARSSARPIAIAAAVVLMGVGAWLLRPILSDSLRPLAVGCGRGPEGARLCASEGTVASIFDGENETVSFSSVGSSPSTCLRSHAGAPSWCVPEASEVRAIGTAFTVDASAGVVRLHEGHVAVGARLRLQAGSAARLRDGEAWVMSEEERREDLARFDGRGPHALRPEEHAATPPEAPVSDEGPLAEVVAEARDEARPEAMVREEDPRGRPRRSTRPRPEPDPEPAPSASEALRDARALLAAGRSAEAREAYEALIRHHGGSASAAAAQVALGRLELDAGHASAALSHFDAYLRSGGPLRSEALYGRVVALRRLGRAEQERAAIETLLRTTPGHVRSAELRERLTELGP